MPPTNTLKLVVEVRKAATSITNRLARNPGAMGLKYPPVPAEKTFIDKVVVNPKLDASLFSKPEVGLASNAK
jgi:hypothetical protein